MVLFHFFLIYSLFSLSALAVFAKGLDIDLNEPAIEEDDQPQKPLLPTKKDIAADIALEKKRNRQREYRKRIVNDPIRRDAFLAQQRTKQKEYRNSLSDERKKHRSEQVRRAYLERKQNNQGFSSKLHRERHRISLLEKEKKASPEELAFIAKIRASDRNRKRKQIEKEKKYKLSSKKND